MSFSVIILAAGQSTRMKSAIPKVLHKVASTALIDCILDTVKDIDVKDCVMVIGPDMEILKDHVRNKNEHVKFAVQKKKLGTADAVRSGLSSLEALDKDILILYGDVPFITPDTIKKMQYKLGTGQKTALVVLGFEARDPAHYGRLVIGKNGHLQKIVEFLDCNEAEKAVSLCNSGIMMVRGKYIEELISKIKADNAKGEFYFTDIVGIALDQGLVCEHLITKEDEVAAVNNRKDLASAESIIQKFLRDKFLSKGVTLIDPDSVYFSMDTQIEEDVTIFPNVFFGPAVTIKSGVQIKSFSHIEGALIEKNAIIGPFARIRPGTSLGANVRVGNFVEIKNSNIASHSKINHLAYLGDTEMGSYVNIGAGTITCNYDGFNKHKTSIEDHVFIGSNVSLVAPVSIGKGAMVAASSAITDDVSPDSLAIARTRQTNITDGAAKISEKNRILRSKNKPL